jgi:hypothetical protein
MAGREKMGKTIEIPIEIDPFLGDEYLWYSEDYYESS